MRVGPGCFPPPVVPEFPDAFGNGGNLLAIACLIGGTTFSLTSPFGSSFSSIFSGDFVSSVSVGAVIGDAVAMSPGAGEGVEPGYETSMVVVSPPPDPPRPSSPPPPAAPRVKAKSNKRMTAACVNADPHKPKIHRRLRGSDDITRTL